MDAEHVTQIMGKPDDTQPTGEHRETWTYTDYGTHCYISFTYALVHDRPYCQSADERKKIEANNVLRTDVSRLNEAQQAQNDQWADWQRQRIKTGDPNWLPSGYDPWSEDTEEQPLSRYQDPNWAAAAMQQAAQDAAARASAVPNVAPGPVQAPGQTQTGK